MPRKSSKPGSARDRAASAAAESESGSSDSRSSDVGKAVVKLGVRRIVSGGQTGVDRGALDAAIGLGIEHGGWCPRGRLAEDGAIPLRYLLRETEELEYSVRTQRNVVDSDGTLVLYKDRLQRGTLLTYRLAQKHARPVLRIRLDQPVDVASIQQWIIDQRIHVLNVAGPRASSCPGIEVETAELLRRVFTQPRPGLLFDDQSPDDAAQSQT